MPIQEVDSLIQKYAREGSHAMEEQLGLSFLHILFTIDFGLEAVLHCKIKGVLIVLKLFLRQLCPVYRV